MRNECCGCKNHAKYQDAWPCVTCKFTLDGNGWLGCGFDARLMSVPWGPGCPEYAAATPIPARPGAAGDVYDDFLAWLMSDEECMEFASALLGVPGHSHNRRNVMQICRNDRDKRVCPECLSMVKSEHGGLSCSEFVEPCSNEPILCRDARNNEELCGEGGRLWKPVESTR